MDVKFLDVRPFVICTSHCLSITYLGNQRLKVSLTGHDLTKGKLVWLEEGETIPPEQIVETTRIGIDSCGEAVDYPYRFYIKDNPWVSKK